MAALSTPVYAQQFAGGELTIDAFAYDDADSTTSVDYSVALEYAINRNIGFAVDISHYNFSLIDDSVTSVVLHSIYHLNDQSSIGFIVGNEFGDDGSGTFYGLEGGFESGKFNGEGYFAIYDNSDSSSVLGLSGTYDINNSWSAIVDAGFGDIGTESLSRISAGAEYQFAAGPSVYAEVGNLSADAGSSSFIGLGATVQFGPASRGTTFDRRSAIETLLPGGS